MLDLKLINNGVKKQDPTKFLVVMLDKNVLWKEHIKKVESNFPKSIVIHSVIVS